MRTIKRAKGLTPSSYVNLSVYPREGCIFCHNANRGIAKFNIRYPLVGRTGFGTESAPIEYGRFNESLTFWNGIGHLDGEEVLELLTTKENPDLGTIP